MNSLIASPTFQLVEEASEGSFSSESESETTEVESPTTAQTRPVGSPIGMRRCAAFRGRDQFAIAHSQSQSGHVSRRLVESLQSATVSCSICLEDQRGVITSCGHGFCKKCLVEWIQTKLKKVIAPSCPNCRAVVDLNTADGF